MKTHYRPVVIKIMYHWHKTSQNIFTRIWSMKCQQECQSNWRERIFFQQMMLDLFNICIQNKKEQKDTKTSILISPICKFNSQWIIDLSLKPKTNIDLNVAHTEIYICIYMNSYIRNNWNNKHINWYMNFTYITNKFIIIKCLFLR